MSASLAAALLESLDDRALAVLAQRLAPLIPSQQVDAPGWLNVEQAAAHLACPRSRVYALVSARRIPFHKDGSRTLFNRDELDAWVRAGGARRP